MPTVYTTTSTIIKNLRDSLSRVGASLANNSDKISVADTQRVLCLMQLLKIASGDDVSRSKTAYTNEEIRPGSGAINYPTEYAVTVTVNKQTNNKILEDFALDILDLMEKAERYDTLYEMKYDELKDLEFRAYKEKQLREKSSNE